MRRALLRLRIWFATLLERLARHRVARKVTYEETELQIDAPDTEDEVADDPLEAVARGLKAKLDSMEEKYNRLLAEYAEKKIDLPETIRKHRIKPGDLVVFEHNTEYAPASLQAFGVGFVAVRTLEQELSRLAGGPVMVVASLNAPINVEVLSKPAQLELRKRLNSWLKSGTAKKNKTRS